MSHATRTERQLDLDLAIEKLSRIAETTSLNDARRLWEEAFALVERYSSTELAELGEPFELCVFMLRTAPKLMAHRFAIAGRNADWRPS